MQKENMIRIWKEEISGEGLVKFVKKRGTISFQWNDGRSWTVFLNNTKVQIAKMT